MRLSVFSMPLSGGCQPILGRSSVQKRGLNWLGARVQSLAGEGVRVRPGSLVAASLHSAPCSPLFIGGGIRLG